MAEVLRKPRLPCRIDVIADLKDRPRATRTPAVDKSKVAAMSPRQEFDNGCCFAMRANRKDDRFIGPIHADNRSREKAGVPPSSRQTRRA